MSDERGKQPRDKRQMRDGAEAATNKCQFDYDPMARDATQPAKVKSKKLDAKWELPTS